MLSKTLCFNIMYLIPVEISAYQLWNCLFRFCSELYLSLGRLKDYICIVPVLTTDPYFFILQIGQSYAVDVTEEEEECSRGFLHVGVLPNRDVSAMEKSGAGENSQLNTNLMSKA